MVSKIERKIHCVGRSEHIFFSYLNNYLEKEKSDRNVEECGECVGIREE